MSTSHKKVVLFDFDGVLVNTLQFSYQIHKDKNENFTWQRFQDFSNGNFHEEFQKALTQERFVLVDDFYGKYNDKLREVRINEILHDTIVYLSKYYTLAIISSTETVHIKEFLQREKLIDYFSDIVGSDIHTSKVVKITMMLEKYHLSSSDTVFVTDTLGDIREASVCNVSSIGVTWGLHDALTLQKGSPIAIVDEPLLLTSAIKNVLK